MMKKIYGLCKGHLKDNLLELCIINSFFAMLKIQCEYLIVSLNINKQIFLFYPGYYFLQKCSRGMISEYETSIIDPQHSNKIIIQVTPLCLFPIISGGMVSLSITYSSTATSFQGAYQKHINQAFLQLMTICSEL